MTLLTTANPAIDLVRFVLACLDEDDHALRRALKQTRGGESNPDLRRRRADLMASRQIVGHAQQLLVLRDTPRERCVREIATDLLRSLALPYAERRGFRDEWRDTASRGR